MLKTPTNTKAAAAAAATATVAAPPNKMAVDAKAGAALAMPPYDEFEPLCGWRREEGQQTLVVHVPEFKREQLKVSISNRGILKITGERPTDVGSKFSRFIKKIEIPMDYNSSEITSTFTSAGLLYIVMPKKIASVTVQNQSTLVKQAQEKPQGAQDEGTKKLRVDRKVAVNVAVVAVAVVVALGAYAMYKYGSSVSDGGASLSHTPHKC